METRAQIQAKIKELEEEAENREFEVDCKQDEVTEAEQELADSKNKLDRVYELLEKYGAMLKETEFTPEEFVNDTYTEDKNQLKLF